MPEAQFILYDKPDPEIAKITLNRPDKHNAQNQRLLYELNTAYDRAAQDPEVKVIILAANGKNFSAGHDIAGNKSVNVQVYEEYDQVLTSSRELQKAPGAEGHMAKEEETYLGFSERWRNIPKVTIAQVQGKCIAAGLMLCWPCDLIVASDDALFSDVTVALGVGGVEWFAHPWELGNRKAKEMLFTGQPLTAEEMREIGSVNRVVTRAELDDTTLELARTIARQTLFALKMAKQAVNAAQDAQGRHVAMQTAFALHHVAHRHNFELHGSTVNPAGRNPKITRYDNEGKPLKEQTG